MLRLLTFFIIIFYSTSVFASEGLKLVYIARTADITIPDDNIGGFTQLGGLLKKLRNEGPVFFLHGGDFLAPSAMSSFDHGSHMIDILNSLMPDAVAVNERELAYKEDELVLRIRESAFPFVSSNTVDPLTGGNLQGVLNSYCDEKGGVNICVMSYLDPSVKLDYLPDRLIVDDDVSRMSDLAMELKSKGADVVLMVTANISDDVMQLLYKNNVDILFIVKSQEDAVYEINGKYLLKQGTAEGNVVVVDINKNKNGIDISPKVLPLAKFDKDPAIETKLEYYKNKLSDVMSAEIGKTATELNTLKRIVRLYENAFGNMAADSIREYYNSDIAFLNSGGIRGNKIYPAGSVLTRGDIQSELPFRNSSVLIELTGKQVKEAMENGLSMIKDVKGRFLQISGMKMAYCPEKPVGSRLVSVSVNGKPIKDDKLYLTATVDFMVNGGDGFSMLSDGKVIQGKKASMITWEIVREYIQNKGVVNPKIEGRIITKCP